MTNDEKKEAIKIVKRRIKEQRLKHKITLNEMAIKLGKKSITTICNYENLEKPNSLPTCVELYDLSLLFGVPYTYLLGIDNSY